MRMPLTGVEGSRVGSLNHTRNCSSDCMERSAASKTLGEVDSVVRVRIRGAGGPNSDRSRLVARWENSRRRVYTGRGTGDLAIRDSHLSSSGNRGIRQTRVQFTVRSMMVAVGLVNVALVVERFLFHVVRIPESCICRVF